MIEALPFLMLGALAALLFTGLPVAFALIGVGVCACLAGVALGEMPLIALYNVPPKFLQTLQSGVFFPAVAMLLLMGSALERSEIARDMLAVLGLILRRAPAGMALAVLAIGVLLAPAAGVVGASVVTLALIAMPAMLRAGYQPSAAAGAVAAAGTVGIILPPAVMLFFLAGQYKVAMGSVLMSTVVPGGVLIVAYALWYMATTRGVRPAGRGDWPEGAGATALLVLRGLILPLALVALVLGSIIMGWATPSQSGAVGALGSFLLAALTGRFTWTFFIEATSAAARLSAMVFLIIMAAAVFAFPFRYFGGDTEIAAMLQAMTIGPWSMILLILGIIFILGFFIDWIEIAVITLPLFYPVLTTLSFGDHVAERETMVWIAALTALVLQTSFLTPPFGFALFFLRGAAPKEVPLSAIYRGALPILAIQLCVIGLVLAWPELVLWFPRVVYG